MMRKLALLAAIPIVLAACNSITGTQQANSTTPVKVCLDDLRAVTITHPGVLPVCAGNTCMVTWELNEVCGNYTSELSVSQDGGRTWVQCGGGPEPNICSKPWSPTPECAGKNALLKVTVRDPIGELVDVNQVQIVAPNPRQHPNEERD